MKKLTAFTLAETLIVILILGILATIMLSNLSGSAPDKTKILYKKAYQITERTVGELVNDEEFYPYDKTRIGFRNTDEVTWPGSNETFKDKSKFCRLFAKKLNTMGDFFVYNDACNFTTSDNIAWSIPYSNFTEYNGSMHIMVDIDGFNRGLETRTGTAEGDRFYIQVNYDGTVAPYHDTAVCGGECIETEFLKSHTVQKDKK